MQTLTPTQASSAKTFAADMAAENSSRRSARDLAQRLFQAGRNSLSTLAIAGLLAGGFAAPASADSYSVGAWGMIGDSDMTSDGYLSHSGFGAWTWAADNGSTVTATTSQLGGGFVDLLASGNTWSEIAASIQFTMRIDGPGWDPVEMTLTSLASTTVSGEYSARARMSLNAVPLSPWDYFAPQAFSYSLESCSGSATCSTTGLKANAGWNMSGQSFYMVPNRDYSFEMVVGIRQIQPDEYSIAHGWGGTLVDGYAHAYIDPVFNFAAGVTGYTLTSSFPTPAPVPEPADWALLASGAALLAWRRRKTG